MYVKQFRIVLAIQLFMVLPMAPLYAWDYGTKKPPEVAATPAPIAMPTTTSSTQDNAKKAADKQKWAMGLGIVAAGFSGYMASQTCFPAPPKPIPWECPAWIAAALVSAKVAYDMSKANNQSVASYNSVTPGGGGSSTTTPGSNPNDDSKVENSPVIVALKDDLKKLEKLGYKTDLKAGTVTAPDGKTYDVTTAEGINGLGVTDSQFQKAMQEANAEAEKKMGGIDKLDGDVIAEDSGAGGGPSGSEIVIDESALAAAGADKNKINRDPSQVAGLSKNLNGDPIGVSSENLFTLINRRYDVKAKNDTFLLKER